MNSAFFDVESIRGLTPTLVDICYSTSYPFEFPSRIKHPPLEILNILVTTLRNKDKKVALIRFDEYVEVAISYEFMNKCHHMNIMVQSTGGYASYLNGRSENTNNTLHNITRALLLNSSNKKYVWCFAYQYTIF